ncbi:MAG: hypothetical protein V7L04_26870 [Nostoc sp.]|uniref:hypothetical protein n=1 Tax=Nostoc sp. TaxID=1180 RepID=UPI002FF53D65
MTEEGYLTVSLNGVLRQATSGGIAPCPCCDGTGEIPIASDDAERLSEIEKMYLATGWIHRDDTIWLIKTLKPELE